ncbi:dipicolinate synthase subunit A [Desulfohalotomaculum tongense]|uniref:dipicolinate synthase subunit DpsA n=1 Tax=Desulforadius tongensis TaxID=1216062 RepID=UPI00195D1596|nr:dipicolinate synthase subunit DpsA [Desulforadius tongensis]MBM7854455.1 dipicolinate synthase subunit A [Desulforadius tongensis]
MHPDLQGIKVAVLGGDAREIILVSELSRLGIKLQVVGLPVQNTPNVTTCCNIADALRGVQAVILPVPGINKDGTVYSIFNDQPLELNEKLLVSLPADTPVFAGFARELLVKMVKRCNLRLIEVLKQDHVAILNSIPSAEGAVQMAMEATPITIHGSNSFVLGYGRTGATLARLLQGMGAKVTVVARKEAHLARVYEIGMRPLTYDDLLKHVSEADIIFNTVPALVLTSGVLSRASSEVVIIDLASPPGGTDFDAAERLGIKALLAPGLPGKVAPKTAGQILAQVIPRLLAEELGL